MMARIVIYTAVMLASLSVLIAADPSGTRIPAEAEQSQASVRRAIQNAIPHLQQGAVVSAKERKCFTCHNQALPVIALVEVSRRGFKIDEEILQRQLQHTWDHLHRGKSGYLAGKGQGGQVMTAGYALWTLERGAWKADETTTAVAHYLAEYQREKNRWTASSQRLPSSGSPFTATYLALRGLSHFGTEEQQERFEVRRDAAATWVLETEPSDTEGRVFQLRTLPYIDATQETIQKAVDELLSRQHADGGWSQTDAMSSDAYATGTVLAALQEVGKLSRDNPAVKEACDYLVSSQLPDGTWHVVTHAKPIQDYYESGFPHDEDQFISITATSWAMLALAFTLPVTRDE